jgi:NDP-sugar pyrophosphorylase family protein
VMLPGSSFKNQDTEVSLAGQPFEPLLDKPALPTTQTPPQTATDSAVILGAGLGERIDPVAGHTTGYSKPGIPLLGHKSILTNIAEQMKKHGMNKIVTQTFYYPDSIRDQLKSVSGVTPKFIHEVMNPPGTASALMKAYVQGDLSPNKPVLVVAGDAITNYDFSHLINQHVKNNAAVTIAGKRVRDDEVNLFGIIESDNSSGQGQSGLIKVFKEKPSLAEAGSARLANTGIYVFSPEALKLLRSVGEEIYKKADASPNKPNGNVYDFAKNFFPALMKAVEKGDLKNAKGEPMTFRVEEMPGGYWDDIGNPKTYFRNVLTAMKGYLGFKLPEQPEQFLKDGVIYWNGTQDRVIQSGAKVTGNVIVSEQPEKRQAEADKKPELKLVA